MKLACTWGASRPDVAADGFDQRVPCSSSVVIRARGVRQKKLTEHLMIIVNVESRLVTLDVAVVFAALCSFGELHQGIKPFEGWSEST